VSSSDALPPASWWEVPYGFAVDELVRMGAPGRHDQTTEVVEALV
jgi:hypothetical protein